MKKPVASLGLQDCLQIILKQYGIARAQQKFGNGHPLWAVFGRAAMLIAETAQTPEQEDFSSKWSVGQGRWATVPWIAVLHRRESTGVSAGVFVAYLFRGDQSGVYLTLNQGSSRVLATAGPDALRVLGDRADVLGSELPQSLESRGFALGRGSDYRAKTKLAAAYSEGCIAHKLYERGAIPDSSILRTDLAAIIDAYSGLIPSKRFFR